MERIFESGPLPRAPQAAPPPVPARPPMNIQPLNVHTKVHTPHPPRLAWERIAAS